MIAKLPIPTRSWMVITAVLTIVTVQTGTMADATAAQPNFIVVLIDDLGWGDFSCFGNNDVETPEG